MARNRLRAVTKDDALHYPKVFVILRILLDRVKEVPSDELIRVGCS